MAARNRRCKAKRTGSGEDARARRLYFKKCFADNKAASYMSLAVDVIYLKVSGAGFKGGLSASPRRYSAALHRLPGFFFSELQRNCLCLLIRSHVNRASPVCSSSFVCTGDFRRKTAHIRYSPPPFYFCDLESLFIASRAETKQRCTS